MLLGRTLLSKKLLQAGRFLVIPENFSGKDELVFVTAIPVLESVAWLGLLLVLECGVCESEWKNVLKLAVHC